MQAMRFTIRAAMSSNATADPTMLRAIGLPHGGVVSVGKTHIKVTGSHTARPSDLQLGPMAIANAKVRPGASVEVQRVMLPPAEWVTFESHQISSRSLARALAGKPLTSGDLVSIDAGYLDGNQSRDLQVVDVNPSGAGLVGASTRFAIQPEDAERSEATSTANLKATSQTPTSTLKASPTSETPTVDTSRRRAPTTAEALLAGLDNEVELVSGWFSLLATEDQLASNWNLPAVAGMLLEGPNGCGKSELVNEAASRAGTTVEEIDISRIFKPERLLDRLSAALSGPNRARVIFVDRLETLTGDEALSTFRTQFIAVLRWFLEEVASKSQVLCVLGVEDASELHESIASSPLLPRIVSIPPPDLDRRKMLFEAAFANVPGGSAIDSHRLAALSSGFSGADVLAAVLHASSMVAADDTGLTLEIAEGAVESTVPSLGSVPLGQITGFGFDKVANMEEAKQRLTEAVIWPVTQPERYIKLGIEPPRGILLWGPPGTGKTFVAKALAHEAGCAFFSVKGAELLDKYVGESERAVRNVFDRARDAAPSIIFFDEFDALAPVRGRSSSSVSDQVVAALLTEIDGVADRGRVAVIAATNRKDLIDQALLRAGRFESHIRIGLPGKEARLALLEITDVNLAPDIDRVELAERTDGFSFADLTGVLREAALATLRRDEGATEVSRADVDSALRLYEERSSEELSG